MCRGAGGCAEYDGGGGDEGDAFVDIVVNGLTHRNQRVSDITHPPMSSFVQSALPAAGDVYGSGGDLWRGAGGCNNGAGDGGGVPVGGEGRGWPGNKCVKHKNLGNTHGRKTVSAVSLSGHGSCGLVGLEQL